MKVVKISSVWCSGCLVMNKIWKKVIPNYDFEIINLDYDMDEDEVKKYNVGDILPVIIFYDGDSEVKRIIGEVSEKELIRIIEEIK